MGDFIAGRAVKLSEVSNGMVFGTFIANDYVRCLKLHNIDDGHAAVISLGPFIECEGKLPGPNLCVWDSNEFVILEQETRITPKVSGPNSTRLNPCEAGDIPLGALALGTDGKLYLLCRQPRAGRFFVDIESGQTAKDASPCAYYQYYMLVAENEFDKKVAVFDSSTTTPHS